MSDDLHTISQQLQNLSQQVETEFSQFQEQLDRLEGEIEDVSDKVETQGQGRSNKFEVAPNPDKKIRELIGLVQDRSERRGVRTQHVTDTLDVERRTARRYMNKMASEYPAIKYVPGDNREPSKIVHEPE